VTPALPPALDAPLRALEGGVAGRLAYYVAGRGDGARRPVVLLHSVNAAASSMEMRPLFAPLARERATYALDLPGFGHSDRADRAYTPELYREAIARFLEQVSGPADVVALSLGAEFAAAVALERPELVKSLVLLSPSGLTDRPLRDDATVARDRAAARRRHDRLAGLPFAAGLFRLLVSRAGIGLFMRQVFVQPPPPELLDYAWRTAHQPGAHHAPFWFVSFALFTPDVQRRVYERLAQPVLVLHDTSTNVRYDGLPALLARRANWEAERIAPGRDLLHWEHADRVVARMREFWGRAAR